MKRFLALIALVSLFSFTMPVQPARALFSPTGGLNLTSTGTRTIAAGAGVIVNLVQPAASGYTIILDGTAQATSTCTVAIQILNPTDGAAPGTYVTPTAWFINGVATVSGSLGSITLTNATTQVITIPGGVPGIQVVIVNVGTATGTVGASINAW